MANELTMSASLNFADSEDTDETLAALEKVLSISTKLYNKCKHNVGTSEEAMKLGEVASLGYCLIINRDSTNFVEVRAATGGTKIIKVRAGKVALFEFGSGVTAPYIIADTNPCQTEYMIVSQ